MDHEIKYNEIAVAGHPDLKPYLDSDHKEQLTVNQNHILEKPQLPIQPAALSGIRFEELMTLFDETHFSNDIFELWRGYGEYQLFRDKNSMRSYVNSYIPYLNSTAPEDTKNMARIIISELKTNGKDYDAAGIFGALAQNGNVCNVQREVGIRAVYADMTNSMLQHSKSNSIENKILVLLQKSRVALAEGIVERKTKAKLNNMNTHWLIPARNTFAEKIGIAVIPDPNAQDVSQIGTAEEHLQDFHKLYTVEHIVKVVRNALNDAPRVISSHDAVDLFNQYTPHGLESYEFQSEFVYDMTTGQITENAVKFMLVKLSVLKWGTAEVAMKPREIHQEYQLEYIEEMDHDLFGIGNLFDQDELYLPDAELFAMGNLFGDAHEWEREEELKKLENEEARRPVYIPDEDLFGIGDLFEEKAGQSGIEENEIEDFHIDRLFLDRERLLQTREPRDEIPNVMLEQLQVVDRKRTWFEYFFSCFRRRRF